MQKVKLGCECLEATSLKGERLAVLMHPASINSQYVTIFEQLMEQGLQVNALFGPQHGILGETQDNMIEWEGFKEKKTGIPVYSLYGEHRTPTKEMLHDIDRLIVDLQDVGSRYYTFIWTMLNCMRACADYNIPVTVLDRPNPIGAEKVEGPVLNMAFRSFVGLAPIPVQHGMTIGELALYFKWHFDLDCDLEVVPMEGYKRSMLSDDLALPWVFPSPNMPQIATAKVYPGGCLLEATNLSEGRGTALPFELFGAPYIDSQQLLEALASYDLSGIVLRKVDFQPTFHKWKDQVCHGFQIHVLDNQTYRSFDSMACILAEIKKLYPNHFSWNGPPYEYEWNHMPIDILSGNTELRELINSEQPIKPWLDKKQQEADIFRESVTGTLIYE